MGFLLPSFIVLILDQLSKQLFWYIGKDFDVIDGILRISLVKNAGSAFGLFQGKRILFIAASLAASIVVAYIGLRMPKEAVRRRFALALILGGALGNLLDRIYQGHVIDFIDMGVGVYRWPVYNFADIAVTVGVVMLLVFYIKSELRKDGG